LRAVIDQAVEEPLPATDRARRIRLVKRWFYVPETGTASQATEQFLLRHIAAARAPEPAPAANLVGEAR